jgi:predicted membrane channel-forming protein YqfA (hemolysin III family)
LEGATVVQYGAWRSGKTIGALAIGFGVAYLLLVAGPPLLGQASAPYPLLSTGDLLDFVTPLVLLPLSGVVFLAAAPSPTSRLEVMGLVALSILWVQGQAMHLAANAIGHYVVDTGTDLGVLVAFLDEDLSHLMWHGAVIGLAGMTMYRSAGAPPHILASGAGTAVAIGGGLFGFTYFLMVVEGRTWPFGLSAAVLAAIFGWVLSEGRPLQRPALGLYLVGAVVALGLSVVWGAINDWQLVEFSTVIGF